MDNHLYICNYCSAEYKPKKRGIQKFCSTSCRVNAFKLRQKVKGIELPHQSKDDDYIHNSYKEKVNTAGIINSAIGAGAVELSKAILTRPENKPATKKDIQDLVSKIQERYQHVNNMPTNARGERPFFDSTTRNVLYFPVK
ncbi:hypothetical protein [Gillisia sp. Hel_I_29]|uniref:hypothetical protein n=1 Tax=Gillisia sp. Hel_I_29 TaxID=1249975 RepID=UPI0005522626|nr:hypothetical protein [Gillisia sp. Hel_I_29]